MDEQRCAVLIVEEGAPDYIEQAIHAILRKRDIDTKLYGKDVLPMAGEYTAEVVTDGLLKFFAQSANDIDLSKPRERFEAARAGRAEAQRIPLVIDAEDDELHALSHVALASGHQTGLAGLAGKRMLPDQQR